mgnify:CR=1 FL=1
MDGQGILFGARQSIEIQQHARFQIAELKIQLAAAAQFQTKQEPPPPEEKARVLSDHRHKAGIRKFLGPVIELGTEMPDGFDESAAQF